MAQIQGTVLAAKISPGDDTATFPTHEDIYGKGGLMSVQTLSQLAGIPQDRQKVGMMIYVSDTSSYYTLTSVSYPLTSFSPVSQTFSTRDYVHSNFYPLTGNATITGPLQVNSNVIIYGNLSASGASTFANTIFSTTTALSVVHTGDGPAMWVGNRGTGDIASFYDIDQDVEVLHVAGTDGTFPGVGVRTSTPNKALTVNGEISANNVIYDTNGNSLNWNNAYTAVSPNSANWNSVYSTVCATSANWNSVYSTVCATSANWNSVYSSVCATSANWNSVYSSVCALSTNWQNTYTLVSTTSSFTVVAGGNTRSANITIGTNDAYHLRFETNNVAKMTILSSGEVGIGTTIAETTPAGSGGLIIKNNLTVGSAINTQALNSTADAVINGVTFGRGSGNDANSTAAGASALLSNTSGIWNSAFGNSALINNTSGSFNVAVGNSALRANTSGGSNTAIGTGSLYSSTTGQDNTAIGGNALFNNNNGSRNTGVGVTALFSSGGNNNSAFGVAALSDLMFSYENTTGLGYQSSVTGSNQVQLGNSVTTTYVYNTVQSRSDVRDKADIRDTTLGLEFIDSLRPVDFKWDMREDYRPAIPDIVVKPLELSDDATDEEKNKYAEQLVAYEEFIEAKNQWVEESRLSNITHDGSKKRSRYHHGLIAQEVKAVLDQQGIDFGGFQDHSLKDGDDVLSIGYVELIAPMIKAIQQLKARIEELENK